MSKSPSFLLVLLILYGCLENSGKSTVSNLKQIENNPLKMAQLKVSPQIHYLDPAQIQARELLAVSPQEAARPVRMALHNGIAYVLMRGQLLAYNQGELLKAGAQLQPVNLMPTANRLPSGEPIRELVDLAVSNDQLFLLDKSNDVYQLNLKTKKWNMLLKSQSFTQQPDPHYIAIESFSSRAYLLDYARNQIWRKGADTSPADRYFKREVPSWQIKAGDPNLTEAIDF